MKRLTEAIEEHWKTMIHGAIEQAARQGPLPRFKKAFVKLEIVTPRGSDNARLRDTCNRVINNLKGSFFEDDNMEHMAVSVVGRWSEPGMDFVRSVMVMALPPSSKTVPSSMAVITLNVICIRLLPDRFAFRAERSSR